MVCIFFLLQLFGEEKLYVKTEEAVSSVRQGAEVNVEQRRRRRSSTTATRRPGRQ